MGLYEFDKDDVYRFKEHVRGKAKESNGQLQFAMCPYCSGGKHRDRDTFSISLSTGQFECKRSSCGVRGNMITLSKDFDFSLGNQVDEYYRPRKQYRKFKTPKERIIPKVSAVEFLRKRGISEEVVKKYEITTVEGKDDILVFPFFDEKGKMEFIKYRKTDFNKERDKNKEWCEKNCKPILFGMKQCNDTFDRLVITEGQIDSLSVATAGIENAVSVPTGAKGFTWVPYCFDWVSRFDEIIVFGDFENGTMTLLEDISRRFPCKIKYVREQDYKGCKDANEILMKYGKDAIVAAVDNAAFLPVKNVIQLADIENVNIDELQKIKTGLAELDRDLRGGIPFGSLTIVTGKRGDGKSTMAGQICLNAREQGHSVFMYSGELPNHLLKAWLDYQAAGSRRIYEIRKKDGAPAYKISETNRRLINEWYRDMVYIYDSRIIENEEKTDLLRCIENSVMQYGVEVVLIDNLMTAMYIDEVKNNDKYDRQGRFVRELAKIALKYNVVIILVAHKRKNAFVDDANDEVSGSADVTNLASIVLSYDRPSKRELEEGMLTERQRKLILSKNRL